MGATKLRTVPLAEAKAKLSQLIREVEAGAEIEITKDGVKVAVLSPFRRADVPLFGFMKGRVIAHDDLIAPPLTPEEWGDLY